MNGNKLKIKLKKLNIEQKSLAEKLGITPQNLTSKLNANNLKLDFIAKVADAINKSVYDLIGESENVPIDSIPDRNNDNRDPGEIPILEIDAMAGAGNGEVSVMGYELSGYRIPIFADADFLIPVKGNSMWPKYNSGDIVACKKLSIDTFFQWNKVYVLDTEQGALIKRIRKSERLEYLMIVSENKEYESFELHLSKVRSISMVLGRISLE